ncbi:MAG: hypothetical protein J6V70_06310 [Kiritimatiellae bacterium]|nr:hypothetical protein [Kiritimatiellia bacterium]
MFYVCVHNGHLINFFDVKSNLLVGSHYIPENVKSAQVLSPTEVVVYCEKSVIVLKKYNGNGYSFYVYSKRVI